MQLSHFVEIAGEVAEIAGVLLIVGGLAVASTRFVLAGRREGATRFERYRHDLGRAILLGLEVLVAADIIQTVTLTPTTESVTVLAMIVAVRTFLSWSLALELEGRWPWQRSAVQPQLAPIEARASLREPQPKGERHA